MININYQKRKNLELFKSLEDTNSLFLSNAQNYIPIYTRFFSLNDTNYNSINLNHKLYISSVKKNNDDDFEQLYTCKVKNINNNKIKEKDVFFKLAPLLDPYKYLVGKYNINDSKLFILPNLNSTDSDCNSKLIDVNNSAYVDGLFLYLTSFLLSNHKFSHGVDYYGSFLAIKNDFTINVFDDIDYLNNSDFFNKNKNTLFKIDEYEHLFQNENHGLKPITINHNTSAKSQLSIKSFDNEIFEDIFNENTLDLNKLKELEMDLEDLTNVNLLDNKEDKNDKNDKNDNNVTLKSNSTCSSRSSYTDEGDIEENCENCGENDKENTHENDDYEEDNNIEEDDNEDDQDNEDDDDDDDDESFEEEKINVTIPKFPVQVIGMEFCENTFDDLILSNDLSPEEWYSALMQIIMTLITYQKAFNFTHNDLHTNNVMYNKTDNKFI